MKQVIIKLTISLVLLVLVSTFTFKSCKEELREELVTCKVLDIQKRMKYSKHHTDVIDHAVLQGAFPGLPEKIFSIYASPVLVYQLQNKEVITLSLTRNDMRYHRYQLDIMGIPIQGNNPFIQAFLILSIVALILSSIYYIIYLTSDE